MECTKCGCREMYREDDKRANIVIHVCFKCGKRIYEGYPQKEKETARLIDWKTLKEVYCEQ